MFVCVYVCMCACVHVYEGISGTLYPPLAGLIIRCSLHTHTHHWQVLSSVQNNTETAYVMGTPGADGMRGFESSWGATMDNPPRTAAVRPTHMHYIGV